MDEDGPIMGGLVATSQKSGVIKTLWNRAVANISTVPLFARVLFRNEKNSVEDTTYAENSVEAPTTGYEKNN